MTSLLRGVAYITGAGSGIGQHTAFSFARHGVKRMALTDLRADKLQETIAQIKEFAPDIEVLPITMNTSIEADVNRSVEETVAKFGSLDIAVNNAGRGGVAKPTHELDVSDWKAVIDVNLTGVWLCQKAQIKQMLKQEVKSEREGRGSIVNVASMLGTAASAPASLATDYTSSKHGVMGLTKTDAVFYGSPQYRIRINAMCPGYVGTPLLLEAMKKGTIDGEISRVPMGRLALMEEIGDAITFLASPMASFVCGHGLLVDGGYTV